MVYAYNYNISFAKLYFPRIYNIYVAKHGISFIY